MANLRSVHQPLMVLAWQRSALTDAYAFRPRQGMQELIIGSASACLTAYRLMLKLGKHVHQVLIRFGEGVSGGLVHRVRRVAFDNVKAREDQRQVVFSNIMRIGKSVLVQIF